MKHSTLISFLLAIGLAISPLYVMAGPKADKHNHGVPSALSGILDEVSNINDKIDNLDSDNDNPLLNDILTEIQGLRGDVSAINSDGAVIKGMDQSEGLIVNPPDGSDHDLVSINGSGSFVAARMTKQGGSNDITFVELYIDGKYVIGRSYAGLKNIGMTQNNPFGVVILQGNGVDSVVIGFQQPVKFNSSIVLRAKVRETGVEQMIGTVLYGH